MSGRTESNISKSNQIYRTSPMSAKAELESISQNQIRILNYLHDNGPTILENLYKDLNMPKPTAGYHTAQLENRGLIQQIQSKGRTKPRGLTEFGEAIVNFLKGKSITKEDRIKISLLNILTSINLNKITNSEIEKSIKYLNTILYERKNEKGKNRLVV